MKLYTIGEIFRQGLLKNFSGKPYADKASVSKIVHRLSPETKETPWGTAKCLTLKQINFFNKTHSYDDKGYPDAPPSGEVDGAQEGTTEHA